MFLVMKFTMDIKSVDEISIYFLDFFRSICFEWHRRIYYQFQKEMCKMPEYENPNIKNPKYYNPEYEK